MQRSTETGSGLADLVRYRAAFEASGDVLYDWDLASDEFVLTGAPVGLFGGGPGELPVNGEDFHARINPEDLPDRMRALSEHFSGLREFDCEYRMRGADGELHWIHDRGGVERSPTGAPLRMLGILRLVTQRKQQQAQIEYRANFDDLTGHFNKMRLREALDQSLAQGLRFDQSGAYVVIGLDQMGMINTAYGYKAGDAVLFEIAQRLDQCLRATDVIGRIGGDRFGVVLTRCDERQAQLTTERILAAVRQAPVRIAAKQVHVTASAGLVFFPAQSKTSFDVMTKAEGALFEAKSLGRDSIRHYEMSEAQRRGCQTNMDIGERVKLALKEDRLCFAYQPVVDTQSGEPNFYECLLRMRSRSGELVAAGHFIPVIEQLGLIRAVDRRGLEMALDDLERHSDVRLAVNISGLTAADRSWLRALHVRLKDRPDMANRLIIEITETAALHDIEDTARFVSVVRELGCQVAVDDFGAGYTTFRHLKALTADLVKIDGSFVKGICESEKNQLFIRNLLSLARSFGLATVAECVETAEDAECLAREGVELLQGYYFGKPTTDPAWRTSPPKSETGPIPLAAGADTSDRRQAAG